MGEPSFFFFLLFLRAWEITSRLHNSCFFQTWWTTLMGWFGFFFTYTSQHVHSQLLLALLFCRANIDEVETEVVEIEAKLDKVRHLMLSLHNALYPVCPSGPVSPITDILAGVYNIASSLQGVKRWKSIKWMSAWNEMASNQSAYWGAHLAFSWFYTTHQTEIFRLTLKGILISSAMPADTVGSCRISCFTSRLRWVQETIQARQLQLCAGCVYLKAEKPAVTSLAEVWPGVQHAWNCLTAWYRSCIVVRWIISGYFCILCQMAAG